MSKGSVWKNTPEGKTVRRNKIPKGSHWTWWTIEMMESPAYRVMSLSAHRIVARIRIELAHHGGKDNGKLPVTFRDFNEYGVHWNAIAPAIREAEALGFIRVTQYGRAGNGEFRIPNTFALTHMPVDEQRPTNDWAKIETIEEAEIVAGAARNKQKASIGKRSSTRYGKRSSNPKLPVSESVSLSTTESVSLSISRVGNAAAGGEGSEDPALTGLREWTTSTLTEVKYTPELKRLYSRAIEEHETQPPITLADVADHMRKNIRKRGRSLIGRLHS